MLDPIITVADTAIDMAMAIGRNRVQPGEGKKDNLTRDIAGWALEFHRVMPKAEGRFLVADYMAEVEEYALRKADAAGYSINTIL